MPATILHLLVKHSAMNDADLHEQIRQALVGNPGIESVAVLELSPPSSAVVPTTTLKESKTHASRKDREDLPEVPED